MRAVVQRVSRASVTVDEEVVGKIGRGFVVLLGVAEDDTQDDVIALSKKVAGLRIFEDSAGKMNLDMSAIDGHILLISQFTLMGDCRKGRRPSFIAAAAPELADSLYQDFAAELRGQGIHVETGRFQKHMDIELVNDGPVTFLVESVDGRIQ